MPNYQQGKIYSIRSNQTDEVYIGSTCKPLSARMAGHRYAYNQYLEGNNQPSTTANKLLEYEDAYIELIENYPCNSKEELNKREGEIIRSTFNCINKTIPKRTPKEYYEDNKEYLTMKQKEYNELNKEHLIMKHKEYREKNKDKIIERKKIKITCSCGIVITKDKKTIHEKTKKHQTLIAQLIQPSLATANIS